MTLCLAAVFAFAFAKQSQGIKTRQGLMLNCVSYLRNEKMMLQRQEEIGIDELSGPSSRISPTEDAGS